jgi:hypothetical protein
MSSNSITSSHVSSVGSMSVAKIISKSLSDLADNDKLYVPMSVSELISKSLSDLADDDAEVYVEVTNVKAKAKAT